MEFRAEFDRYRKDFENYLTNHMKGLSHVNAELETSVNYSLFSSGKRIRPVLMLAFCDLLSGDRNNIYPFACGLEMIHTYSLIHDDLPCMDNDTMRRGKPCNHIEFGEDMALLAGDALLTQAFESISDMEVKDDMLRNQVRSINVLANCAGRSGMISGQCYDLRMDSNNISYEEVMEIYRLKTGQLFSAACSIGAIMSGGSERDIDFARDYGEKLGIAFQLVDDILDNEDKMLRVFDKESPRDVLMRLTDEAERSLQGIEGDTEFLLNIAEYLTKRTH